MVWCKNYCDTKIVQFHWVFLCFTFCYFWKWKTSCFFFLIWHEFGRNPLRNYWDILYFMFWFIFLTADGGLLECQIANKRPMGHKGHQSSGSKLPSPAFRTVMMIHACKVWNYTISWHVYFHYHGYKNLSRPHQCRHRCRNQRDPQWNQYLPLNFGGGT